jgi:hypothetical protein
MDAHTTRLPTVLFSHDVTIGMDPQKTQLPAVLPFIMLHGMMYYIVTSLFVVP